MILFSPNESSRDCALSPFTGAPLEYIVPTKDEILLAFAAADKCIAWSASLYAACLSTHPLERIEDYPHAIALFANNLLSGLVAAQSSVIRLEATFASLKVPRVEFDNVTFTSAHLACLQIGATTFLMTWSILRASDEIPGDVTLFKTFPEVRQPTAPEQFADLRSRFKEASSFDIDFIRSVLMQESAELLREQALSVVQRRSKATKPAHRPTTEGCLVTFVMDRQKTMSPKEILDALNLEHKDRKNLKTAGSIRALFSRMRTDKAHETKKTSVRE